MKPKHVIGLLGTTLDRAAGPDRWNRWRPSLALCQQEDLVISHFTLLYPPSHKKLSKMVAADIGAVSHETAVDLVPLALKDPWDLAEVYSVLFDWAREQTFDTEAIDYLLHITTGTHVQQICLFLLNEAHYLPGQLLQTGPPSGSEPNNQPSGTYSVIDLDLSKYDRLASRFEKESLESQDFLKSGIATKNAAFNHLIERIETVVLRSSAPMLLTGATGAGKSQLAKRVYELRQQRRDLQGAFVEVNCATLRGDTAMSTLFGHVKGAFTGAQRDRPGLLREAHGGLLFLDEIGELGLDEQAMLLRALEEKVFLPLGGDRPVKSNFQLIAGTNRDLRGRVREGKFREDLLARINLWHFELPSLADRREDLEPNIAYELQLFAEREDREVTFNKEAKARFLKFARSPEATWNANFRDLNAAVTRMATLASRGRIAVDDVDEEIARLQADWQTPKVEDSREALCRSVLGNERYAELDPFDAVQLGYAIEVCRASRTLSEAGRRLFAMSRQKRENPNDADRLRKYLARHDLDWKAMA